MKLCRPCKPTIEKDQGVWVVLLHRIPSDIYIALGEEGSSVEDNEDHHGLLLEDSRSALYASFSGVNTWGKRQYRRSFRL